MAGVSVRVSLLTMRVGVLGLVREAGRIGSGEHRRRRETMAAVARGTGAARLVQPARGHARAHSLARVRYRRRAEQAVGRELGEHGRVERRGEDVAQVVLLTACSLRTSR